MYAKKALVLAASAALAEQALAAHNVHHRHMHHLQERAIKYVSTDVVVVTDYVTVFITDGEPSKTEFLAASRPHRGEGYASLDVSTSSSSSSTSTSSTTSSTTSTPAPVIETPAPAPSPTTLVTVSKPVETPTPSPAAVPANVNAQQDNSPPPAQVASTPAVAAPAGPKKGFAYNNADFVNNFFTGGWAYNWDSSDYGNLRNGIEFVPMLWGPIPDHTNNWVSNSNAMIAKGAKNLLSFNEPDNSGQSNLSPADAAQSHVQYMNPFAGKARIGSPAITNSGQAGQGLDWLQQFMNACKGANCAIDFCVTHWYADVNSAQSLFDHLAQVHQICDNRPVWLTEFAPFGSDDQIADFLSTNLPKLEALPYLERFSYFMVNTGSLLSSTNSLSSYGKVYASS